MDGHPVFADSGTYTYHTEPAWRNYFIGTLAHNTIRINKTNQSKIAGSTLWLQHYTCSVLQAESNEEKDIIRATHNGYKNDGITHTRELTFDKINLEFRILDRIETKGKQPFLIEMPFHLHPDIEAEPVQEHDFNLKTKAGRTVLLQTDRQLMTSIVKGQTGPEILGWYSDSFLHKEPTRTILCSREFSENIQLETIISIN